jgi:hypothetical protein
MDTGDTNTIEGLEVYLKEVYFLSKETQTSSAKVILGSSKLTLKNANKAKLGASEENVDGTKVALTGSASGISKITVGVAGEDSSSDYILAGSENAFSDPVFGNFKVAFNGLTPALDDGSRETIVVDNSANTGATLAFTDYRGNEKTLTWAISKTGSNYDPQLNQSSTRKYVVIEGQQVNENDYVLLAPSQESEFGHIFQLSDVDDIKSSNPSFTLTDAMSADTVTVYLTSAKAGYKEFYIDGQAYCANNVSTTAMRFTWGAGATCNGTATPSVGNVATAFPLIKTKNGAYITLVDNRTALIQGNTYERPGNSSALIGMANNLTAAGQIIY